MSTECPRPRLKRGAFQIYTGEGKGKSTASMGLMLRDSAAASAFTICG